MATVLAGGAGADAGAEVGAAPGAPTPPGCPSVPASWMSAASARAQRRDSGRFGRDRGQPTQAGQASYRSDRHDQRNREDFRKRLHELDCVAELVGCQSPDVSPQLCQSLDRILFDQPDVPLQGLGDLGDSIDAPTHVVGVAGVVVDDGQCRCRLPPLLAPVEFTICGAASVCGAAANAVVDTA